LEKRKPKFG